MLSKIDDLREIRVMLSEQVGVWANTKWSMREIERGRQAVTEDASILADGTNLSHSSMVTEMSTIETIGPGGQISLGKKHAGQTALVDEIEPGVWLVKIGAFVPDSERWLHTPENQARLDEAIAWAEATPAFSENLVKLEVAARGG